MPRFVGRMMPLALMVFAAGCSDLTGPEDLSPARRLWESQNISSYEFTLQRTCFCGGPEGPVVVTVVNDQVVRVFEQGSGTPLETLGWPTIDALFEQAESAHAGDRLLAIEYHQDKGYPTRIEVCCLENDSGVRYVITDLDRVEFVDN